MLKLGIPIGAVQNALKKEGKDPNVISLDPDKSLSSQQQSKAKAAPTPKQATSQVKKIESDPPLKKEYAKFFKVCIELPQVFTFIALSS
jgi:hypothetical protein